MICALCKTPCEQMFLCMPCCEACRAKLEDRQEQRAAQIKEIARQKKWRNKL